MEVPLFARVASRHLLTGWRGLSRFVLAMREQAKRPVRKSIRRDHRDTRLAIRDLDPRLDPRGFVYPDQHPCLIGGVRNQRGTSPPGQCPVGTEREVHVQCRGQNRTPLFARNRSLQPVRRSSHRHRMRQLAGIQPATIVPGDRRFRAHAVLRHRMENETPGQRLPVKECSLPEGIHTDGICAEGEIRTPTGCPGGF